jgi:hypothetical protein
LKFEFNFTEGANSGIKYGLGNNGPSIGLEYQILDDENHPDAKNGISGNRTLASLYDLIPAQKEGRFVKGPGEWNRGRIVLYPDGKAQHWLNGRKVLEYTRGSEEFKERVAKVSLPIPKGLVWQKRVRFIFRIITMKYISEV